MVLFQNINVKARIEALWRGEIYEGTVRYTGVLVGRSGEWVGVELDRAVSGGNSGLYRGIQYFSCQLGHGIFVHARNIRFMPSKRMLFNSYKKVSTTSSIDTTLFGSQVKFLDNISSQRVQQPSCVTSKYVQQLLDEDHTINTMWVNQKGFHKSHLVGNHIRPATAQPQRQKTSNVNPYKDAFISPASISATHVPRPLLKRMVRQDYFGTTIPRNTSLS